MEKLWVREGHTAMPSQYAKNEIGRRIRKARLDQGLKSKTLATMAGRTESGISDVERGTSSVSLGSLFAIAEALGVPAASLLPGETEPEADGYNRGYRHGYLGAIHRLQEEIPGQ